MPACLRCTPRLQPLVLLASVFAAQPCAMLHAAEIFTLTPDNWDAAAPQGKEVDAIYGDLVLRNDRLVAVVAQTAPWRNANMTTRNVGGCVIDLTLRDEPNDQLTCFYPTGRPTTWQAMTIPVPDGAQRAITDLLHADVVAPQVMLECTAPGTEATPALRLRYTLADGWDYLLVETLYTNQGEQPIALTLVDELRADNSFDKVPDGPAALFWAYDKWWNQAYGVFSPDLPLTCASDRRLTSLRYGDAQQPVMLAAGESLRLVRALFPGRDLLAVRATAGRLGGAELVQHRLAVRYGPELPAAGVEVSVLEEENVYASGRTGPDGELAFSLPPGRYRLRASGLGGSQTMPLTPGEQELMLAPPGYVLAAITDEHGAPIPCKVAFRGLQGTSDPDFGHESGEHGVRNLVYAEQGRFRREIAPGRYECLISYGPEYDAVYRELEVLPGQEARLTASLVRVVQTPGWVSADFHSHSSPSGDNTASQLGRVLNLLCEHIEFAPCTEHNRLSTYVPHLEALGVRHLMATCTGIEHTDNPGTVNHHNVFPLVMRPYTQDYGAPPTDADMELKVERLALWDGGSHKLIQQNHPDLGSVFFDKNYDGQPDGGFARALAHIDVIEVHPPHLIFQPAQVASGSRKYNNTIFNWLQGLNQGLRYPGVVNTDAHYNYHGSGFLRNYLRSPTDDPAEIKVEDIVRAAERGQLVMTSAPFLEVLLRADAAGELSEGGPGDDVAAPGGRCTLFVRVQCANWYDIDRVQVFLNGRPDPGLNFTREATPDRFMGGVIKFEAALPLELKADTHLIVAAAGMNSTLGPVLGPDNGRGMPIAVSNPIFVDVDGGGFTPNRDTLDAPLPVTSR